MTTTVLKYMGKKYLNDPAFLQDPYFEHVQTYDRKGRPKKKLEKRKRALDADIPQRDRDILKSFKARAYRLDNQFGPSSFRFGLSNVIGLLPVAGDTAEVVLSAMLVCTAMRISNCRKSMILQMCVNIFIDFVVGLIPFLGDLADVFFKCNTKNAILLEKVLTARAIKAREALGKNNGRITNLDTTELDQYHTPENGPELPAGHDPELNGRIDTSTSLTPPEQVRMKEGSTKGRRWLSWYGQGDNRQRDVEKGEAGLAKPSRGTGFSKVDKARR